MPRNALFILGISSILPIELQVCLLLSRVPQLYKIVYCRQDNCLQITSKNKHDYGDALSLCSERQFPWYVLRYFLLDPFFQTPDPQSLVFNNKHIYWQKKWMLSVLLKDNSIKRLTKISPAIFCMQTHHASGFPAIRLWNMFGEKKTVVLFSKVTNCATICTSLVKSASSWEITWLHELSHLISLIVAIY